MHALHRVVDAKSKSACSNVKAAHSQNGSKYSRTSLIGSYLRMKLKD